MKRIIAGILSGILILGGISAFAEENVNVKLNDELLVFDTQPQIINDRTLVPMRKIFEEIGAQVQWDDGTVNASYNDTEITLTVGDKTAVIKKADDIQNITLDTEPMLINDRTLVPLRFVGESLGLNVAWDENEQTVYLCKYEKPAAIMDVDGYGRMVIELYPEYAPKTVANFIKLAKSGFYNGLTYHRVIKDFMIQGGDPMGTGFGGSSETIKGEFAANGFTQNTLAHKRGVISMARSMQYNSASSQFFIMHQDNAYLDGEYAAFGKVKSGIGVVDKIANVKTDANDKPLESVVISSIVIDE